MCMYMPKEGEVDATFEDLLVFVTGADHPPSKPWASHGSARCTSMSQGQGDFPMPPLVPSSSTYREVLGEMRILQC